jgi:hypothetical protein
MANRTRPTHLKRESERAKAERQKQKAARRIEAKQQREQAGPRPKDGEDPDIAGIVPGPQPPPWGYDDEEQSEEKE